MSSAPKSLRLQLALMGRVNVGKSSFLNLVTGQEIAVTSPIAGTTTDVVEKNQELQPLGPVTWLDTAGFGDSTELGDKRLAKTLKVFERADVVLLVLDSPELLETEKLIVQEAEKRGLPLLKIYNKADLYAAPADGIAVNALDKGSRDQVLNALKAALIGICPEDFITPPPLLGDLLLPHETVVMIIPIDFEAPKGRLIMPQVQALRDCLDHEQTAIVVKENDYLRVLDNLKTPPALVVCDSQVVDQMVASTPKEIKCTTFSTLFARLKGDLEHFVEGAAAIGALQDGDKVLVAESCTHHAAEDDIGRVKIPRWLQNKTGKKLDIRFVSGRDFPADLASFKLVIQCGGCMVGRREILSRINICAAAGVPITNYGICISELKGVLERILEPFPQALQTWRWKKLTQGKD